MTVVDSNVVIRESLSLTAVRIAEKFALTSFDFAVVPGVNVCGNVTSDAEDTQEDNKETDIKKNNNNENNIRGCVGSVFLFITVISYSPRQTTYRADSAPGLVSV